MEPANGLLCRNMLFSLLDVLLGSFVSLILYASFAFVPGYCVTVFQLYGPKRAFKISPAFAVRVRRAFAATKADQ